MPIIGHEYGHMIENRMIGKGLTRQGGHAGMMGEPTATCSGWNTSTRTASCLSRARTGTPSAHMPPATSLALSGTTG